MPKWLLPTLSEVLSLSDPTCMVEDGAWAEMGQANSLLRQQVRAEQEWSSAIAALSLMLNQHLVELDTTATVDPSGRIPTTGLVISGPTPILSQPELVQAFSTWALTADPLQSDAWLPFHLLPAETMPSPQAPTTPVLPLVPGDPLATEPFCLMLTSWFSLVVVLGTNLKGQPALLFSFVPEVVQQAWEALRPRILLMRSHQADYLDDLVQQFPPVAPDYQTVMQFSRLMLASLPDLDGTADGKATVAASVPGDSGLRNPVKDGVTAEASAYDSSLDVELLQAIAHEIRTPLTTIRTLTRLLLKRTDLAPDVLKRLQMIDRECSDQIDRFGLIFHAVELETSNARPNPMALTRTSLTQVFQQSIPRWQQQAQQRQITLDVVLPPNMPTVVSDPNMLDRALTSLVERFTRNLPGGSQIQVEVSLAGDQLKLQFQSQTQMDATTKAGFAMPTLKSLGQLLMFQPETGSLSLNLAATKNLFHALGGKLIVRQRPQEGEVMTVFLPLEMDPSSAERGSDLLKNSRIV